MKGVEIRILCLFLFVISSYGANPTHPDEVEAIKRMYNSTGGPNWTIQPNLDDPCSNAVIFNCIPDGSYSRINMM